MIFQLVGIAPLVQENQIHNALFRLEIPALSLDIHIGHAQNVQAKPLSGLLAVAECSHSGHRQIGFDGQSSLDGVAVGVGQPAGIQIQIGELQNQVLHHVAGVLDVQLALFGQQHQILGSAHQELVVTGGAFQCLLALIANDEQLGFQGRVQTLAGFGVIVLDLLQNGVGDFLIGKSSDRLSVFNQCAVVHNVSSCNDSVFCFMASLYGTVPKASVILSRCSKSGKNKLRDKITERCKCFRYNQEK